MEVESSLLVVPKLMNGERSLMAIQKKSRPKIMMDFMCHLIHPISTMHGLKQRRKANVATSAQSQWTLPSHLIQPQNHLIPPRSRLWASMTDLNKSLWQTPVSPLMTLIACSRKLRKTSVSRTGNVKSIISRFLPTHCIILDDPMSCFPISTIQHDIKHLLECDTINSKYHHWHITFKMDAFLDWIISYSILATSWLLHWIFRDGLVIVLCLWLAFFAWIQTLFQYTFASWPWWIAFISGTWNAPDACLLWQIFIYPRWHYVLPPHFHRPIDWDYYRRLNYKLQIIHVQQAREFWKLWHQFSSPVNIALASHGSLILCCVASIIESILTVSWHTSWIVAYKFGILCKTTMHSSWMPRQISLHKTPSHFWQKFCQQRRKHRHISLLATYLSVFNTVLNIDDITAQHSTINFDSDASLVICDNSANVHVCNDKNMFVSEIRPLQSHVVATIGGLENQAAGIGDIQWGWKDHSGQNHTYCIRNVLYFPKSPINMLSVTEFANQLNDNKGTRITTYSRE